MTDAIRVMNRRRFVELTALAAAAFTGCPGRAPAAVDGGLDATAPDVPVASDANVTGLPHLGGAPDTHQGQTVAAFVDTVVPGAWRDPTGAPGGIDVGAPGLFFDPTLPTTQVISLLTLLLDSTAARVHPGSSFARLGVDERDQALAAGLITVPELVFGIQLAKLAYLSSDQAGRHLGYPGPNGGYVHDPDFSFNRPMSREATPDGNYP